MSNANDANSNATPFVFGLKDFTEEEFMEGKTLLIDSCRWGKVTKDFKNDKGPQDYIGLVITYLTHNGKPIKKDYSLDIAFNSVSITPDGKRLVGKINLDRKTSAAYVWLTNSVNAGFPEHQFDGDPSVYEGSCFVMTNVAIGKKAEPGKKQFKELVPLTRVDRAAYDQAGAEAAARKASTSGVSGSAANVVQPTTPAATVPNGVNEATKTAALSALTQVLESKGGTILHKDIWVPLQSYMGTDATERAAINQALVTAASIQQVIAGSPIQFENGTFTLTNS